MPADSIEQERKDTGMRVMETWESVPSNQKPTKKTTVNFVLPDKVKMEQKKEVMVVLLQNGKEPLTEWEGTSLRVCLIPL